MQREEKGEMERKKMFCTHKGCISHFQARCRYAAVWSHKIRYLKSDPKNHMEMVNVNTVMEVDCPAGVGGLSEQLDEGTLIVTVEAGGIHMPTSPGLSSRISFGDQISYCTVNL